MEQPVNLQAAQLLWSLVCGAWLGLQYDVLRASRRLHPKLTPLSDTLFVLLLPPFLLLFALYVGHGRLRVFMLFGLFAGASLYFLTLSRPVLGLLIRLFSTVGRFISNILRFFCKILKKFFRIL